MREQVKFQFDNSFEDRTGEHHDRPKPTFTEADVEAARNDGFAAGHAAGLEEAHSKIEALAAEAAAEIARQLAGISQRQADALANARREAVQLAARVATKLASAALQRFGLAEVEALLASCLDELREEPRIVLRASESIVATLRPRIDGLAAKSGYSGHVVLLPDDSLKESDCRIEWADGGLERDAAALMMKVDVAVGRFLDLEQDALPADTAPERSS